MPGKERIYDHLIGLAVRDTIPLVVMCNLTYRCPLRCRHCYVDDEPRPTEELTAAEYRALFRDLSALGTLFLTFSGGEATVRADFLEILAAARDHHFAVRVFSGGWDVDGPTAAALARLKPLGVEFSLQSAQAEVHDAFVGSMGAWRRIADAVRHLVAVNLPVMVKTCVMGFNVGEVRSLYELVTSWGAEFRHSPFLSKTNAGSSAPLAFRLTGEQLEGYYRWMLEGDAPPAEPPCEDGAEAPRRRNLPTLTCMAAFNNCSIDPYGNVRPCLSLPINAGNIRERPFAEIWNGDVMSGVRALAQTPMPACADCELDDMCFRCPAASLLEEGDIQKPPAEHCRHARAKKAALQTPP